MKDTVCNDLNTMGGKCDEYRGPQTRADAGYLICTEGNANEEV